MSVRILSNVGGINILFTGGAGDVFAVEAHLTDKEKYSVGRIYLATPSAATIFDSFNLHPRWRDIEKINLFSALDWSRLTKPWFLNSQEVFQALYRLGKPQVQQPIFDASIYPIFLAINARARKYNKTGFQLDAKPCETVFDFATNTSHAHYIEPRNFTKAEIKRALARYEKNSVEVGIGKTTLRESLSLVAGCRNFIGVDSFMSVVAAIADMEISRKDKIFVRSRNDHLYRSRFCYYSTASVDIQREYT